jgi:SNF2 family DNA or RNA helicase
VAQSISSSSLAPTDARDGLRPYQREGVRFLEERRAALLADEMGLGKTVQAIVALRTALAQTESQRALVVAPASLRLNWLREFRTWAPGLTVRVVQGTAQDRRAYYALPISVLITSYDQIRTDAHSLPAGLNFGVTLLDEAQRIKNVDSSTALGVRLLPRHRAWALTGTPLENTPADVAAIFQYLRPGTVSAGMSRSEMIEAVQGFMLRRTKDEVLSELPPIIVQDMPLDLAGQQRQRYEELWSQRHELRDQSTAEASNSFALITKLKQLCNMDTQSGESVKLDALRLVCENLVGEEDKLLVFSQYVTSLRFLQKKLNIQTLLYHGELTDLEKDRVLDEFRNRPGPLALLISLRAGAVGLNLQEASTIVLFDRWWNPAVEDQAINRAHRFGRTRPLHVFRFLVTDSIEQRIEEVLSEKRELFDAYVNQPDWEAHLRVSPDELNRILR